MASASFTFFLNNTNYQKITKHKKRQKKHDEIILLGKSKLDSIETLVSQVLIIIKISHEDFYAIIR